jgi:RNA polymerase sigma-70 factor, ECF subfamily
VKKIPHGVFSTVAEGQVDNFSQLLEQQIPRLRRYALALHRSDRSSADDLVQDTLVRAVAKQHLWEPGTNLQGWLSTIMHHQNVNDVRRSVSREGLCYPLEGFHNTLASMSDTSASLQLRDLERAIAQLPHERREILLLVGLEGMSYQAVSSLLGVPIGTVRSRISRGREMLREIMDSGDRTGRSSRARKDRTALLAA